MTESYVYEAIQAEPGLLSESDFVIVRRGCGVEPIVVGHIRSFGLATVVADALTKDAAEDGP